MNPYRAAPPRRPAPRASWWRRLHRAGRRLYWTRRPPFLVFALWLAAWPLAYLVTGYLQLRRVRAAMRNGQIARFLGGTAAEIAVRGVRLESEARKALAWKASTGTSGARGAERG